MQHLSCHPACGDLPALATPGYARRAVLAGLAGILGAAQSAAGAIRQAGPQRVDLHYHIFPPAWLNDDLVRKALPGQTLAASQSWEPQGALAAMDRMGIRTAVGSIPPPGIWFGDGARARALARACNEYGFALKRAHPGRFGYFATLPLPDVAASLAELAHACDTLAADGVCLLTNYGKHLADRAFDPLFDALDRRGSTVYVHPIEASCCGAPLPGLPPSYIEFPADTTRSILQWIMRGGSARWPRVKLIFSHAGGYVMGGLGRLQFLSDMRPDFGLPRDFRSEVAKLYYEISSSADKVTMAALRAMSRPRTSCWAPTTLT